MQRLSVLENARGVILPNGIRRQLLVDYAQQWKDRCKSGDPGIFGRLEEEIGLLAVSVPFEIIPGVTSASAAAAAASSSTRV